MGRRKDRPAIEVPGTSARGHKCSSYPAALLPCLTGCVALAAAPRTSRIPGSAAAVVRGWEERLPPPRRSYPIPWSRRRRSRPGGPNRSPSIAIRRRPLSSRPHPPTTRARRAARTRWRDRRITSRSRRPHRSARHRGHRIPARSRNVRRARAAPRARSRAASPRPARRVARAESPRGRPAHAASRSTPIGPCSRVAGG